jgi:hypothetical protein
MTIKLKLTTPLRKIEEMIAEQTTDYLNRRIRKNYSRVVNSLHQKIPAWIRSQPEIQSLLDEGIPGSLNALFGLYGGDAVRVVHDIIDSIKQSTFIKIDKINRKYQGNIEFSFQSNNFANILGLGSGHVITEKGADLHWLEWLLTAGDIIVVVGYQYNPKASGRSGGGVMSKGTFFRVPPQFAGTMEDNFITRAFANREKEIEPIMARLFE